MALPSITDMRCLRTLAELFLLLSLCWLSSPGIAQETPKAQYGIKEDEPPLGTRIRRDQVVGSIAMNRSYAQLSPEDKQTLHSWWENIPAGDEPPFPVGGLRALYDPLRKAHDALSDPGELFAVAAVGADGKVIEAKVFQAPSQKMANFVAQLLLLTSFKPAVCAGQPCRMDYPLHMTLTVRVR